jgi:hypothetical protein
MLSSVPEALPSSRLSGVPERIASLRQKLAHQSNTLAYYEVRIQEQTQARGRMNVDHLWDDDNGDDEEMEEVTTGIRDHVWTDEELGREEVRELERKKRELQKRLRDADNDYRGLMDM